MITADEYQLGFMVAYLELETAINRIVDDHDELFDEEGDLLPAQ